MRPADLRHDGLVMIQMRLLALSCLALLLAACQTGGSGPIYSTNVAFVPEEASYVHVHGSGTITGRAFLQTPEGERPAARSRVVLVPATEYARERVRLIYRGRKMASLKSVGFEGADKRYHAYTRSTIANREGNFAFKNVGPGEYFVTAAVVWTPASSDEKVRASLIETVNLAKGETADVTLSGVWN